MQVTKINHIRDFDKYNFDNSIISHSHLFFTQQPIFNINTTRLAAKFNSPLKENLRAILPTDSLSFQNFIFISFPTANLI
uniref:Uncharacterized protein n=1 Tax=Manihot esculenta TaxID=3983 RepID=A0A2C9W5W9_MANES